MLRQIYNLTQSEFARRLKTVNRQDVHNWESGRSIPSIKSLLNIVNTFNTSIEIFFENDIYFNQTKHQHIGTHSKVCHRRSPARSRDHASYPGK
jgi:transcriptional regulator with XRE-family HTH domain